MAFDGNDGGFDGGLDDGGGDDGGDDGGEEDNDGEQDNHQGEDRDKDGHPDEHGHHPGHAHHRGRGHHPVVYGWPPFGYGPAFGFGAFGYAPPPYYAYPPASFRQAQPGVVYIEKNDSSRQTREPEANLWHYCPDPPGYYPEVKECAADWAQVAPQAEQDTQE